MGNLLCGCTRIEDDNELKERARQKRWIGISKDPDYKRPVSRKPNVSTLTLAVYSMKNTTSWTKANGHAQCVTLHENCSEYQIVKRKFDVTSKNRKYVISKIERIENPYLLGQYLLKKEEIASRYGLKFVETDWLFHGTKSHNLCKVLQNNFDWRLHGTSRGEIFGKGVSFSPFAGYAGNYCTNGNSREMLLCEVIVTKECYGNEDMILPNVYDEENQLRCDTAINQQRSVFVKFSDNEFYPLYKITFNNMN